jgi:hypothetical protein
MYHSGKVTVICSARECGGSNKLFILWGFENCIRTGVSVINSGTSLSIIDFFDCFYVLCQEPY